MAKDVEERTALRKAHKAAAEKEKDAGNAAFKAGQTTEAIARYSAAIDFFKGDKAVYSNRALAHIKRELPLSHDDARALSRSPRCSTRTTSGGRRRRSSRRTFAVRRRASSSTTTKPAPTSRRWPASLSRPTSPRSPPPKALRRRRRRPPRGQGAAGGGKAAGASRAARSSSGCATCSRPAARRCRWRCSPSSRGCSTRRRAAAPRWAGGIARLVALLSSAPPGAARPPMVACERRNQYELHVCGARRPSRARLPRSRRRRRRRKAERPRAGARADRGQGCRRAVATLARCGCSCACSRSRARTTACATQCGRSPRARARTSG